MAVEIFHETLGVLVKGRVHSLQYVLVFCRQTKEILAALKVLVFFQKARPPSSGFLKNRERDERQSYSRMVMTNFFVGFGPPAFSSNVCALSEIKLKEYHLKAMPRARRGKNHTHPLMPAPSKALPKVGMRKLEDFQ